MIHHKKRWVFSPLDNEGLPVARDYAIGWEAPMHYEGYALALCLMNAHQLAAARQDPRLIVLQSIHSQSPVDAKIVSHHAAHGVKPGMVLHELLTALAAHHPGFEPEY